MRVFALLILFAQATFSIAQLKAVPRPDGTVWVNDRGAQGFLVNGWMRYDFDGDGNLLRKTEFATIAKDTYKLREVELVSGQEVVVYTKTWIARAFFKYTIWFMIVFFLIFFSRVFVNSAIYNRENGTDFSPIYGPGMMQNVGHSMSCTFTFWWDVKGLKTDNRSTAIVANTLSVTALTLFFGSIFAMALSGELH